VILNRKFFWSKVLLLYFDNVMKCSYCVTSSGWFSCSRSNYIKMDLDNNIKDIYKVYVEYILSSLKMSKSGYYSNNSSVHSNTT